MIVSKNYTVTITIMSLSNRASIFLSKQEWRNDAVKSIELINKAFDKIGFIPTQELIDFQIKYGGLTIYSGLEPICFGILHGKLVRGDFAHPKKLINKLIHYPPDEETPNNHFSCADTLYQEYFTIDEEGSYYEGWDRHATNFDNIIEDYALFEELGQQNLVTVLDQYLEDTEIDFLKLKQYFDLEDFPDYPKDIIFWGRNEDLVIRINPSRMLVFSRFRELFEEDKRFLFGLIK